MVPVAMALSLGIISDAIWHIPVLASLLVAVFALIAWPLGLVTRSLVPPLICLFLCTAALGAAYHASSRRSWPLTDIGFLTRNHSQNLQARGVLLETPRPSQSRSQFYSQDFKQSLKPSMSTTIKLLSYRSKGQWHPLSGKATLIIRGDKIPRLAGGAQVEIIGRLHALSPPLNPGEHDFTKHAHRHGIHATILVPDAPYGIERINEQSEWAPSILFARLRSYGTTVFDKLLSDNVSGIAAAILLGQTQSLPAQDRERYRRTGVVHVLVISGQHFLILAVFLQGALQWLHFPQRKSAAIVMVLMILYAFLVGLRPPVVRACVTFTVICLSILLTRKAFAANALALAWIIVVLLNPGEVFNPGCHFSFMAVIILHWIVGPLRHREPLDRLEILIQQSRPQWVQWLIHFGRADFELYRACFILWLLLTPLIAAHFHILPFAGLVIGPPVMCCISLALVSGFLLLVTAAVLPPLANLFAWLTEIALQSCEALIDLALKMPGSYQWSADIELWWLRGLYLLIGVIILLRLWPRWMFYCSLACLLWLCIGLLSTIGSRTNNELRITFLAVGHGGCTVIEPPDGRVIVYDAGSLRNPEITRDRIAPFLWSRGIRSIDELMLSHADFDHYNGVPDLLERFPIGQVSCNPTFAKKDIPPVQRTLALIKSHGIPIRTLRAGDRLQAGAVTFDVLHPPTEFQGSENAQSLVLLVQHKGHRILLTGDLAEEGMARVLSQPKRPVDVLMAPHHGSPSSNTAALAEWAQPQIVISSQGRTKMKGRSEPYVDRGALYMATWLEGAITVRSDDSGLLVETFLTQRSEMLDSQMGRTEKK